MLQNCVYSITDRVEVERFRLQQTIYAIAGHTGRFECNSLFDAFNPTPMIKFFIAYILLIVRHPDHDLLNIYA